MGFEFVLLGGMFVGFCALVGLTVEPGVSEVVDSE